MKAVVIGGGAGGLAVANLLAKQGYQVELFEKNSQLGGRMGLLTKDGFTFDTGPSWYLMPEVFEHYFDLLGYSVADFYTLKKLSPAYKVFYDYAQPITIRGNTKADAAEFEKLEPGAGKRLERYIAKAKQTYSLAIDYFLYNPFRSLRSVTKLPILRKSPWLIGGLTSPLHRFVSKRFRVLQLQQILEYPMVFLGTSPYQAPSLYRLMSYLDFEQGVFFPEGGMHDVTQALVDGGRSLGVQHHVNTDVQQIQVENGQAKGVTVDGKFVAADLVISNADLAFSETKLLAPEHQSYPASYWNKRKSAPSALLLYLGVSGELPELEHHNLFFVEAWQQNFTDIFNDRQWPEKASMYVSRTSATSKQVAPDGQENLFVLVPLPPGRKLTAKQQSSLVDRYLAQLEEMMGVADFRTRVTAIDIRGPQYFEAAFNSWQGSALGLNHTLLQSAFLRPQVKSKKVSNLYYVGGMTQPGIGIPMCLISAELVIKSLANDKSPGPLATLPEMP